MKDSYKTYNDKELVQFLSKKGRRKQYAFEELYNRYGKAIHAFCRKFLNDDISADDIAQETFIKFLKKAEEKAEINYVKAYLFTTARNLCINRVKEKEFSHKSIDDILLTEKSSTEDNYELNQMIETALALIPENYRQVVILNAYHGYKYREIAELLDMPLSTVRNHIIRGKKKLKEILTPFFKETSTRNND